MKDLGFNEKGERLVNFNEDDEEEGNGAVDLTEIVSEGDIEMTEISTINKENLKSRAPPKDSSLDFLDKEIEI
jgi:hypothetical protein